MADPTPEPTVTPPTNPASSPAPGAPPTPGPEATFQWADKDGRLSNGWRDHLPDELKQEKSLEPVVDIPGLAKNYVYTKKMVGKNTVAIPNENSPQADWDAFYEAAGRPKTVADYKFDRPKDIPEDAWDKDFGEKLKQAAWEEGFSAKQMARLHKLEVERMQGALVQVHQEDEQERTEAETALKRELGDAYEEQMALANAFIARTTDEPSGQRAAILEIAGNNPFFIEWCMQWGKKVSETLGIDTASLRKTPKQDEDRLAELRTK